MLTRAGLCALLVVAPGCGAEETYEADGVSYKCQSRVDEERFWLDATYMYVHIVCRDIKKEALRNPETIATHEANRAFCEVRGQSKDDASGRGSISGLGIADSFGCETTLFIPPGMSVPIYHFTDDGLGTVQVSGQPQADAPAFSSQMTCQPNGEPWVGGDLKTCDDFAEAGAIDEWQRSY